MRGAGRDLTIGERVNWYRRQRGLSQEVLAGLVGRTTDWLSKIENGRAQLERLSVIKSLADALDVSIGDLLGDPSVMDWTRTSGVQTVPALRAALLMYPALTSALASAPPVPAEQLRAGVYDVWSAYQASRFGYVTNRLPRLIAAARAESHQAKKPADRREARRMLALSYHAAAATMTKLGESDLCWIASDRGLVAAEEAEDPVVVASLLRSVAHSMLTSGHFTASAEVVEQAATRLDTTKPPQGDDPAVWCSLLGSLHLVGAMAAARADQGPEARAFLARARQQGQQMGYDGNHAWTAFGPTNVAVHEVSVALELGEFQVALVKAPQVDVASLPVERRVRHTLEVARVYHLANRPDHALQEVLQAEQVAPEQVRYHYIARELVISLMRRRSSSRPRPALVGLAKRLRVA